MCKAFQTRTARTYASASGQAGLLAVAITILIALVLAGTTIAGLSRMNATRSVVIKQTLQTYYTAQAGLQEALATRMIPRSNYWNFDAAGYNKNGVTLGQNELLYFSRSGLVYQDPDPTDPQGLIGQYRYVILGGDAARKNDGSYYDDTETRALPAGDIIKRILATDTLPQGPPTLPAANDSRFIVISNAVTCKRNGTGQSSVAGVDQLNVSAGSGAPSCKTGYTTDEITLVGVVSILPEGGGNDRITQTQIVKDRSNITMPIGAFVPGYTQWKDAGDTVDFDRIWSSNSGRAVNLVRVVFYNFMTGQIDLDRTVTPGKNKFDKPGDPIIPAADVIRLYFDGPIDYRSISPTNNRDLSDCKGAGADTCNIRVEQDVNGSGDCQNAPPNCAYQGNTLVPLLPGSTQVILLPPLKASLTGNTQSIKVFGTKLRGYNNIPDQNDYVILFKTG